MGVYYEERLATCPHLSHPPQSFFAKHYRQHTPLEHLHLLHSIKYMADCTDAFLRAALARDASSGLESYGTCSVM